MVPELVEWYEMHYSSSQFNWTSFNKTARKRGYVFLPSTSSGTEKFMLRRSARGKNCNLKSAIL